MASLGVVTLLRRNRNAALSFRRAPPHISPMTLLAPVLIALIYALVSLRVSLWRSARMLDQNSTPLQDPALELRVKNMAKALELSHIPVHVFQVDQINGLAAPDGRIFLTRGFVQKYRHGEITADEMASVIAHELGHVALGHAKRRMVDMTGTNAVFVVLAGLLNRVIPFVGLWIANAITAAFHAKLSRRDEFEADAYASALLVKAGIGTQAQKSMFRKLDRLTGGGTGGGMEWLRSHPVTAERIRAIEEREARWNLS